MAAGKNKRSKRSHQEESLSEVTEDCSDQAPRFGGSFQATNDGSRGEVRFEEYGNNQKCKHVVQAEPGCQEIQIKYRSVAVQGSSTCSNDNFRFGWEGTSGLELTPATCNCFGDGCDMKIHEEYTRYGYDYYYSYNWYDDLMHKIGPDTFTINANAFTFFFASNEDYSDGHVIFDWECIGSDTTTAPTTK